MEQLYDIVYITANPWVTKLLHGKFYKIINVWDEGWDERFGTVLPSVIYEETLKALRDFPGKRFIIHFLQPHHPFITLDKLLKNDKRKVLDIIKSNNKSRDIIGGNEIWDLLERGVIDKDIIIHAYKENLALTMPYVKKLVDVLPGKTVVTSDHGEAFGEFVHPLIPLRIYDHPNKIRIPCLTKVPWLVIDRNYKYKTEIGQIRKAIQKLKTYSKI